MEYTCSVCGEKVDDLVTFHGHTEEHVIEEIKKKHPEWVKEDGICPKCVEYFKQQLKGEE